MERKKKKRFKNEIKFGVIFVQKFFDAINDYFQDILCVHGWFCCVLFDL